jgi:hypothetical protein
MNAPTFSLESVQHLNGIHFLGDASHRGCAIGGGDKELLWNRRTQSATPPCDDRLSSKSGPYLENRAWFDSTYALIEIR